jgi:hypothetical protein
MVLQLRFQLIPTKTEELRQQPYIYISGAAINSNKTAGFFEVNAAQYTSHYKTNRALSILPIQAHFNSNKYRSKKSIPSNNTYVSLEGFLEDVETDATGQATLFRVSVDNINFLGKATLMPSATGTVGKCSDSSPFPKSLITPSLKHRPRPRGPRVLDITSTLHLRAHPSTPPLQAHLPPASHHMSREES